MRSDGMNTGLRGGSKGYVKDTSKRRQFIESECAKTTSVPVIDVRRERNEIWFPLLEAAEVVANPYFGEEEDASGAFKIRALESFAVLRKAIDKARSRGYVR